MCPSHAAAAGASGGRARAALAAAGTRLLLPLLLLLAACRRHALAEPARVGHAAALGRARLVTNLRWESGG